MVDSSINISVDFILADLISHIICDEMSDKERTLRFEGVTRLKRIIDAYSREMYDSRLLIGIAEKNGKMLLAAKSKTEVEAIVNPKASHFDGNKFIPDKYSVPKEELIAWSVTSLKGPLVPVASKRYIEVFAEVFPEESKRIQQIMDG